MKITKTKCIYVFDLLTRSITVETGDTKLFFFQNEVNFHFTHYFNCKTLSFNLVRNTSTIFATNELMHPVGVGIVIDVMRTKYLLYKTRQNHGAEKP